MLFKILLVLFLSISSAHADIKRTVENVATVDSLGNIYTTIGVPTTSTVYTKSVSLVNHSFEQVGVMYKASSSGTITVSLQAERSFDRPATESAASSSYIVWNGATTIADNAWHMVTLDTVVMPYVRFKLVGSGSNDATTTMQIKLEKQ